MIDAFDAWEEQEAAAWSDAARQGRAFWRSSDGMSAGANMPDPTKEFVTKIHKLFFAHLTVDFGCGAGRMAKHFDRKHYLGVDVSKPAIINAKLMNRGYEFEAIDDVTPISWGHCVWAHDVLRHIPDADLVGTLKRFRPRRLVITEPLGRIFRRRNPHPIFSREIGEYDDALQAAGFMMVRAQFMETDYTDPIEPNQHVELAIIEAHRK